jgi:MFS family permease
MGNRSGVTFLSKFSVYYGWRVVAAGFVLLLLMFGLRFSFGLYIKPMAETFSASRASISGSASLYMVFYSLFALIAGRFADKYGPKRVLIGGVLFMGVGMLLSSVVTSVWQYYLSYGVLVAIGSGSIYVPVAGAVSKFFTHQRNFALGITISGSGLGQYLIIPFMQQVLETKGWQTAFLYSALLMLVFGTALPLILLKGRGLPEDVGIGLQKAVEVEGNPEPKHPSGNEPPAETATDYTLRQAVRTAPFWTYFGMYFLVCFVFDGVIFVHMVPYLTDVGFTGQTAAKALGFVGLLATVTMALFSPLGDRLNKRLLLTSLLGVHALFLFWLLHIRGDTELWLFISLYGVLMGAMWPLTVSVLSEIFGSTSISGILGACTLAFGLSGLIAPWAAGYMFDLYRSYDLVLYITIFLSLASSVCAYYSRKTEAMM